LFAVAAGNADVLLLELQLLLACLLLAELLLLLLAELLLLRATGGAALAASRSALTAAGVAPAPYLADAFAAAGEAVVVSPRDAAVACSASGAASVAAIGGGQILNRERNFLLATQAFSCDFYHSLLCALAGRLMSCTYKPTWRIYIREVETLVAPA
jgi:hypothetical protein